MKDVKGIKIYLHVKFWRAIIDPVFNLATIASLLSFPNRISGLSIHLSVLGMMEYAFSFV